jgi:hypothetical protein
VTQNGRTEIGFQEQRTTPAGSLTHYFAATFPGVYGKQMCAGLLNEVGIIYNDPGVLFVGTGPHVAGIVLLPIVRVNPEYFVVHNPST